MEITGEPMTNDYQPPSQIGEYNIMKTIGKGKFAVVYRAQKIGEDQVVALKRISVDMMNEKARDKCLKEVKLLQNLDHPNIIRYMDSFITENDLIIVYEWAAAGDLKRQLRKAQEKGVGFEERVIWKYFSQICLAIQHMHEKRTMHRDLKPANIFLTLDGTIKVGDLGLSRELSEHTIQAHSKVGTPLYMSPEVLKGGGYDFKSDIWSLGCLLYELAMLKSPFKAEGLNLYSLFQKISNGEYQPLPDVYSPELRSMAYSMISINPEDRPEINQVCTMASQMRQQTANTRTPSFQLSSLALQNNVNNEQQPVTNTLTKQPISATADGREAPSTPNRDNNPFSSKQNSATKAPHSAERNRVVSQEKTSNNRENSETRENKGDTGAKGDDDKGTATDLMDYFHLQNMQEDVEQQGNVDSRAASRGRNQEEETFDRGLSALAKDKKPSSVKPAAFPQIQRTKSEEKGDRESRDYMISTPPTQKQTQSSQQQQPPLANGVYRRSKLPTSNSNNVNSQDNGSGKASNSSKLTSKQQNADSSSRPISGMSRPSSSSRPSSGQQQQQLQQAPVNGNNDGLSEIWSNASQSIALMEQVYSKLRVLGYPLHDPALKEYNTLSKDRLLPLHFAVDPQVIGNVAGQDRRTQFQSFPRFVHVIRWLGEKIGHDATLPLMSIDLEYGTPVNAARQIILAAQRIGPTVYLEEIAAITPTSTITGFGYNVVLLLAHFADCAMTATNFQSKLPLHQVDLLDGIDEVASNQEQEDEIVDLEITVEEDEEPEPFTAEAEMTTSGSIRTRFFFMDPNSRHAIDPELWKQEAERVGSTLKKHEISMNNGGINSTWQTHMDRLLKHVNNTSFSSSSTNTFSANKAVAISSSMAIVENMSGFRLQLQDSMQKILVAEKMLAANPVTTGSSLQFQHLQQELEQYRNSILQSQQSISTLTQSIAEIDESLEETTRQLEQRTTGDGGSGPNRPVVRLKEAIRALRDEIQDMHVSIGISTHELINKQKEAVHAKQRITQSKARRRGKSPLSSTAYDDEVNHDT